MTEQEIRKKISDAIGNSNKLAETDFAQLMGEIQAFMKTLPREERSKFYWSSGAECIAMALPDSYFEQER